MDTESIKQPVNTQARDNAYQAITSDIKLMKVFLQLKNQLDDDVDTYGITIQDEDLIRYVIGYKGDIDRITSALNQSKMYRNSYNMQLLDHINFNDTGFQEMVAILPPDKSDKPAIIVRCGLIHLDVIDVGHFMSFVLVLLNRAFEMLEIINIRLPSCLDKITVIVDLKDATPNYISLPALERIFKTLYV